MSTTIEVMLTVVRDTGNPACYRVIRKEHCGVDEAMDSVRNVLRNTREKISSRGEELIEEQLVITRSVGRRLDMDGKYIVVQVDDAPEVGPNVGANVFHVYERQRDFNHAYYVPCRRVGKENVFLNQAREQVERLEREDREDTE